MDVVQRMQLERIIEPFTRCLQCNDYIYQIDKETIKHKLLLKTDTYFNEFYICRTCDKVFWKGSHYEDMQDFIQNKIVKKA
ncbi:Mut7-C RNAse domain-containing protein [Bacteroidota bacterium]